jgi:hypothetical protein
MDEGERRVARDVAIEAAEELARRHGADEVGEAEFAEALINLRVAAQIELDLCVGGLRAGGASWADVGALLGMTRQSAQERFAAGIAARQTSGQADSQDLLTALAGLLVGAERDGAPAVRET